MPSLTVDNTLDWHRHENKCINFPVSGEQYVLTIFTLIKHELQGGCLTISYPLVQFDGLSSKMAAC